MEITKEAFEFYETRQGIQLDIADIRVRKFLEHRLFSIFQKIEEKDQPTIYQLIIDSFDNYYSNCLIWEREDEKISYFHLGVG